MFLHELSALPMCVQSETHNSNCNFPVMRKKAGSLKIGGEIADQFLFSPFVADKSDTRNAKC